MKRSWSLEELVEHATLLPDELNLLANKTVSSRLGLAVLLKCFQYEGRFPQYKGDIPVSFLTYIAQQIGIAHSALRNTTGTDVLSSNIAPIFAYGSTSERRPNRMGMSLPTGFLPRSCPENVIWNNFCQPCIRDVAKFASNRPRPED